MARVTYTPEIGRYLRENYEHKTITELAKDKNPRKFVVMAYCRYNSAYGSPTRECFCLTTRTRVDKACKLEVVKKGESNLKEKIIEKAKAKK